MKPILKATLKMIMVFGDVMLSEENEEVGFYLVLPDKHFNDLLDEAKRLTGYVPNEDKNMITIMGQYGGPVRVFSESAIRSMTEKEWKNSDDAAKALSGDAAFVAMPKGTAKA